MVSVMMSNNHMIDKCRISIIPINVFYDGFACALITAVDYMNEHLPLKFISERDRITTLLTFNVQKIDLKIVSHYIPLKKDHLVLLAFALAGRPEPRLPLPASAALQCPNRSANA